MIELAAILTLALLQVGDVYTTHLVLSKGGTEQNPAMRWVLDRFGFGGLVLVKVVMLAVIIYAVLDNQMPLWFLLGLCAMYAGVVVWNWRQHKKS